MVRKRRWFDIDADGIVTGPRERAHQRLAEVARASSDENPHALSDTEKYSLVTNVGRDDRPAHLHGPYECGCSFSIPAAPGRANGVTWPTAGISPRCAVSREAPPRSVTPRVGIEHTGCSPAPLLVKRALERHRRCGAASGKGASDSHSRQLRRGHRSCRARRCAGSLQLTDAIRARQVLRSGER
jgi:hypothetical protein